MSEYLNLLALQKQNMDTANPMRNFMSGAQDYNTIIRQQMDNKAAQMRMDQDALENPMRLDALRQSLDTGRLNQQVTQRRLDADQQASTIKSLKMAADMSRSFAAAGDIDGLRSLVPKMQEMLPPEVSSRFAELAELGDIDSIQQGITAIDALGKEDKQQATYDIGATQELIDEQGNLFTGLTVTDRVTGKPRAEVVPMVPGTSPVGALRQRASSGTAYETKVGIDVQAEIDKAAGKADIEAKTAPVIAGNVTAAQEKAKDVAAWQDAQESGWFAAQSSLPGINRMIEILPSIGTGKPEAFLQAGLSLFGLQNVDAERFSTLARKQVLNDIKALGSNPTEGERAFILTLQASLENGEEVNAEMLQDLKRVNERMIERGRWVSANPGKGAKDYIQEFGDVNKLWSSELNESVTMEELEKEAKDSGISVAKLKAQLGIR